MKTYKLVTETLYTVKGGPFHGTLLWEVGVLKYRSWDGSKFRQRRVPSPAVMFGNVGYHGSIVPAGKENLPHPLPPWVEKV